MHKKVTNCNVLLIQIIKERKLEFNHKPVLLEECIKGLNIKSNGIYVDGTVRRSGTQQ